jgi:hypothetical protein
MKIEKGVADKRLAQQNQISMDIETVTCGASGGFCFLL